MASRSTLAFLAIFLLGVLVAIAFSKTYFNPSILSGLTTLFLAPPIVSLLIGAHFKRGKVVFLSFLLFVFQLFLLFGGFWHLNIEQSQRAIALMTPVGFLILGLMEERGIFGKIVVLRFVATIALSAIAYWIGTNPAFIDALNSPFLGENLPIKPISEIAFVLYVAGILLLSILSLLESKQVEKSLPWVLLVAGFPVLSPEFSFIWHLGAAGIIFTFALSQDAYKMAYIDSLTGIPSRRAMDEYFEHLSPPFTIAMADIDHFKKFNDTYGHDVGDDVLRKIAQTLKSIDGGGKVFRYGGEEFAVVFAGKEAVVCKPFLEDVKEIIQKQGFIIRGKKRTPEKIKEIAGTKVTLTISVGACDDSWGDETQSIIKKADELLYSAKKAGRNCVKVAPYKKN
ncbi:MAG: GGDEF domain-containing protein [Campylobacteraceae bacterium]|nr:GGDEF domain-containing protein [Campylobacteraceae bacterium]